MHPSTVCVYPRCFQEISEFGLVRIPGRSVPGRCPGEIATNSSQRDKHPLAVCPGDRPFLVEGVRRAAASPVDQADQGVSEVIH